MDKEPLVSKPKNNLIADYWSRKKQNAANPTEAFKQYCVIEPWAVECKEYDN